MKADNYSWFYLYYWFSKKWPDDWKDTSAESGKEPATPENYDVASESFPVDEDAIDTDKTCRLVVVDWDNVRDTQGNPVIQCDYTDPDSSQDPFLSKGGCVLS
jgi:hypothetical protein